MSSSRLTFMGVFPVFLLYVALCTGSLIRKSVDKLTETEVLTLQNVLRALEDDQSDKGFQAAVASYHGEPSQCTDAHGKAVACCVHGMATFPQWHRLFVTQFEQAMVNHGLANIGIPFWDWTQPLTHLPSLVENQIFIDPDGGRGKFNAWFAGDINIDGLHTHTARAVDDRLFEHVQPGENTRLFDLILDALEQTDYCQFEVQFEIAHNHIHYLVGGRHQYSLSTLEYSAYDPLFFLHHSNLDRIFVIWQMLQKKRHKPYDHADCSVELFRQPLHPFDRESNPIGITRGYSRASQLFSHIKLGYQYDDLTLNGMDVDELHDFLEHRSARERAYAVFSLYGLGFSADVRVHVCEGDETEDFEHEHHCEEAGDFFILGGHNEMPWQFHLPFYFDVTDGLERLGVDPHGHYHVLAEVFSVNGTSLGTNVLPHPYGDLRPHRGFTDPEISDGRGPTTVSRKDVEVLTVEEVQALRQAMARFQADTSVDGFQAVAEFHGLPAKCPHPDAKDRYACCIHGMATFPHWHRLFMVEVEDELRSRGLEIGIPYWDWTRPGTHIPLLASESEYQDQETHTTKHNPFYNADVAFLGEKTSRQEQPELSETPKFGDHTELYDGMLLAFEQTNFCDFEVQFEVVHNAPHFLVGGNAPYSLSTLHYSAFDPIFYLHHSNVDRLWAIWQKLQILRGLPYKAHCASTLTHRLLKPFGFPPPWNNDQKTFEHARPTDVYDYEHELDYTYDTLHFGGMTVEQLNDYLHDRQTRSRTFVGIQLHNIGISAWATVSINAPGGTARKVGHVAVLGGEKEMAWRFDRLFKMEITDDLVALGLLYDDEFEVHLEITDVEGNSVPEDTFSHDTIIHTEAQTFSDAHVTEHVRSDVDSLTREQVQRLRDAFHNLELDSSIHGYNQIAAFHGQPKWCPSPSAEKKYACCAHGMAVFPHWHRLLTVQAENALHDHGFTDGLPYWDWTLPMTHLPEAVEAETFTHPVTGQETHNPLHDAIVDGHKTTRHVMADKLFVTPEYGHLTPIAETVMLAFEQEDFCDFEIQFEIAHNYIHALVGGNEEYSMASLRFTAYDPLFYLHHSNTDRIWAIWQALQKYRGKPYNSANCAIASMRQPLQPFAQTSVTNPDPVTRDHSVPFDVFNYHDGFHYHYDNFQFNGMSIPQIQREVVHRQHDDRVFAGFMLHGTGKSVLVDFNVCLPTGDCQHAGQFYLLGDEYEWPWAFDRLFKYEITSTLKKMHLHAEDRYDIRYTVTDLHAHDLGSDLFGNATIIHHLGHKTGEKYMKEVLASSHVRQNLEDLTVGEMESLKSALNDMEHDGSFEKIAKFHGYPGLCQDSEGHPKACCIHGSATFPHWHRLYVEQVENALLAHGSAVSVPYWDWTKPIRQLPDLINKPTFFNSRTQRKEVNPFFRSKIPASADDEEEHYTSRDPQPELFDSHYFLDNVLLALEQTSFCDFEVQFEIVHNALHSWLGGRGKYSMSGLDYSAFDPVFFLHHANVDRIWAIWQALQRHRGLAFEESDCALNLMRTPLHPFDDASQNEFEVTVHYSRPVDVFDYSDHLDYHYDNLKINDWTIPQLEEVLKNHKSHDRLFAGFLLHNIGTSADVEIYICVQTPHDNHDCDHLAGKFAILGGEYEMPFSFDRLYKFEISDTVRKLGLSLNSASDFQVEYKIKAVNGSYLDSHLLPEPSIIFVPGEGKHQDEDGHTHRHLVRKDVRTLSPTERHSLVEAMEALQADHSADGFQSLASFHALPPLCPSPQATERFACCVHGMATFPLWHRLYAVQFEDALRRHGALVGIPYLDSLEAIDELPSFLTSETYDDPIIDMSVHNPWSGADIDFENASISRNPQMNHFSERGPHGYDTWSWNQYIYALEQENFCDFEVQFEIAHNAIHAWLGGNEEHSMGHLHYASYDPAFLLHHAYTDRIFAIWQQLQKHRGHNPDEVNCAMQLMQEPLKPFSFGSPYNLNPDTTKFSKPEDGFDYQHHFHYEYDKLELQGLDVPRLHKYIEERKEKDRVFAGFMLHGLGTSAHVQFSVCPTDDQCFEAGSFDVLGGSAEMPWRFDRLYKYEITDVLHEHHIDVRDSFHIDVTVTTIDGQELNDAIEEPSIIFDSHVRDHDLHDVAPNRVRHDLSHLTERDIMSLKAALRELKRDHSKDGYQSIAAFHGSPPMCPSPEIATHACCVHGMPTFPHWHRLYTVEIEDALVRHGSSVALPYWDWTLPIDQLPELFTKETYYDAWRDEVLYNPFARGYVESEEAFTVRQPQPELTKRSRDGKHSVLFDEVLLALEQTDYCDFEVQYEVVHNAIHYLVGGRQEFSLSSLEYSAYDPIFFVHHTFVDKIWVMWQELQKHRGLPHDRADCAVNFMNQKLHPFDWAEFNVDVRTREHAVPQTVFDYEDLGYHYDNFELGGHSLEDLEKLIHQHQSHARVFAGFHLHGIGTSADVIFHVCKAERECVRGGGLFILGGPHEMPWTFDRLFKYDITDVLHDLQISPEDVFDVSAPFTIRVEIHAVNKTALPASLFPAPTIIYEPAHGHSADHDDYKLAGVGVRKDINTLSTEETASLRRSLRRIQQGFGPLSFQQLAAFHGFPGMCQHHNRTVACCHHGMASFPQWHRLFIKNLEMLLTYEGARIGLPYWDWTQAFTELPSLVTEEEGNPFHHGTIEAAGRMTSRAPRPQLFTDPEHGDQSFFFRQVMLAFEQRDYCDFEVQFEVAHNAIHSWVGGTSPYGMSTLEYSAYDPLFYIHHSNVDRQFAIWQALQKYRGLDYNSANCDIQDLRRPLEPFNRPENPIIIIRQHARAIDAFNYHQFNYQYDNLNFHGHSIPELDHILDMRRDEDRVFANFMLHGIGTSADVRFDLCDADNHCTFAGTFAILGGPLEMPWRFDRLFKYDVTHVFKQMHLRPDSEYHFDVHITAVNGTELDCHLLDPPSVSFVPGRHSHSHASHESDEDDEYSPTDWGDLTRHEVSEMSLEQVGNLRNALYKLQNDHGPNGYEAIASFHGAPGLCPEDGGDHRIACCKHGMPAFPHWHRLLTVQFERALKEKGARVGIPYWDWTRPSKALPSLFTDQYDNNPFLAYHISFVDHPTERDVQRELFSHPTEGDLESLFHQAIEMLEETNYCDFEVQYEMLHNAVHALVGGTKTYGMATLGYSAFDPFFMVHHSSIDRLWQMWQTLQKLRHKSFNYARCAGRSVLKPLEPFSYKSVNADPLTLANSRPIQIFDAEKFHYHYDNLRLNGHELAELNDMVNDLRSSPRTFAAILLHGLGTSATVEVEVVNAQGTHVHAGYFYVLGGPAEMPWAYERPYKLDITDAMKKAGIAQGASIGINTIVTKFDGTPMNATFSPVSTFIERPPNAEYDVLVVQVGPGERTYYVVTVKRGTRIRFHSIKASSGAVRELGSFTNALMCNIPPGLANSYNFDVEYQLEPGDYYFAPNDRSLCLKGYKMIVRIEDDF